MAIIIEPRYDSTGKLIQEHDVLKDTETEEMVLVVRAKNKSGVRGLAVENQILGTGDWLDVYPNGVWTIVGNAGGRRDEECQMLLNHAFLADRK